MNENVFRFSARQFYSSGERSLPTVRCPWTGGGKARSYRLSAFSKWRPFRVSPIFLYRLLFFFLEYRSRMKLTPKAAPPHLHRPIRPYWMRGSLTVNRRPFPKVFSTSMARMFSGENGSKICGRPDGAMPRPVSVMVATTSWRVGYRRIFIANAKSSFLLPPLPFKERRSG